MVFGDVNDEQGDRLAALVDDARAGFGRLDVMVNNAGASGDRSPIADANTAGFDFPGLSQTAQDIFWSRHPEADRPS